MPPKSVFVKTQTKANTSKSREVISLGPKEVISKHGSRRTEDGLRPTTARALVLRNGKHGARGTGEISLATRISGREKLDLLAEDLTQRFSQALSQPFKLEKAIKFAESQFLTFLDDVVDLQDHEMFYDKVKAEILARQPPHVGASPPDPFKNATFVAQIIASRIHSSYMLASAWKIIGITLTALDVDDSTIKEQLQRDTKLRAKYLVLYDLVKIINNATQKRFSLLATSAPHWKKYFKQNPLAGPDEPEFVFEWGHLKDMHKSFLDSIVLELCLSQSPYPKKVLYQILSEAIEEAPRDARQFPQALWDALGDLSIGVNLQEIIEAPLLGPEGEKWKEEPRQMPPEYEKWVDAQIFSETAAKEVTNYKDNIYPLEKTKTRSGLEGLWRYINTVYQSISGKTIDTLWMLDDCKKRIPTWHAVYFPKNHIPESKGSASGGGKKKPLAITNGYETDDSLPALISCTDSSEDEGDYSDDNDDTDEDNEEEEDDEEGYDTDEEDQLREFLREAMDVAAADPDFYDPRRPAPDFEELAKDRQGNPFLKLLGNLRGRMVAGDTFLRTTDRTEPKHPYANARAPPPPSKASGTAPRTSPTSGGASGPKSTKATVEEVSDEDENKAARKKKKKKPKKKKPKKKSIGTTGADDEGDEDEDEDEPVEVTAAPAPVEPTPTQETTIIKQPPTSPKSKSKSKTKPKSKPTNNGSADISSLPIFGASNASLPLFGEQTAQSSRKYLRTEGLDQGKAKIKTRAKEGNLLSIVEKEKSFFSRFLKKEKPAEDEDYRANKHSFFKRLTKKAQTYMHQLLNTSEDEKHGLASMRWEHFLTVMREMGFSYDPSTAGSSVRFDPPDSRDPSITFHKPHPDPTLGPIRLKRWGKRLKEKYGWCEEDFLNALSS